MHDLREVVFTAPCKGLFSGADEHPTRLSAACRNIVATSSADFAAWRYRRATQKASELRPQQKESQVSDEANKESAPGPPEKKSLDWVVCPKHGVRHPLGATCPRCDDEPKWPSAWNKRTPHALRGERHLGMQDSQFSGDAKGSW